MNLVAAPNALAERLASLRAAGNRIIDLTGSNPTRVELASDESWLEALTDARSAHYEPEPFGLQTARQTIAELYCARGVPVESSEVVLCSSTSEAYSILFKLLADPGDCVLFPRPSYPLLEYLALLENVQLANYQIAYDGGYYIDLDSVRRAITPRCRAMVLVSPNNPTGSCVSDGELMALRQLDVPIISDEVFADYPIDSRLGRVTTVLGNATGLSFCLGGLSKSAALPQLKLAWIVVQGAPRLKAEALARLEVICDTYLSVNTPVQVALPTIIQAGRVRQEAIRSRLVRNEQRLKEVLKGTPISPRPVHAGWTCVLQLPRLSLSDWSIHLLDHAGVLVQPGWFYDDEHPGVVVVSLLTPERLFDEGLGRLVDCVNRASA